MNQPSSMNGNGHRPYSFTARDVVAIGFRHQRVMVLCFVGVVAGVLLSALALPTKYRAETKLLVKRERVDPIVTPEQNAPMMFKDTVGAFCSGVTMGSTRSRFTSSLVSARYFVG